MDDRTQDYFEVSTKVPVAELIDNEAQVSRELSDSSRHSLPNAPGIGR